MSEITITPAASAKIAELVAEEDDKEEIKLRVYIVGGGCSGFQYGFAFDSKVNEDDIVQNNNLVVDGLSMQYLHGATIDYKSDLQGARFVVDNPHAKTTCGCGSSFSI